MNSTIIANYQQRSAAAQQEISKYEKLISTYSLLRLVIFALLVVAIYVSLKTIGFSLLIILFCILMLAFTWLVSKQSHFEEQKSYFTALKTVVENELASITDRANIYDNGNDFTNEKHFYTADLDIFGKASLFQLVNRAATMPGKNVLASWLSAPTQKPVVLKRQEAVKELATNNDWKLDIQARLLFANKKNDTNDLKSLFIYLKTPLHLPGEKWLKPYIKVAPYLLLGAIVAGYFYPVFTLIAIAIGVFNSIILVSKGSYMMKSSFIADKIGQTLANYSRVFKIMEAGKWQSANCNSLTQQLTLNHTSQKIEDLSKLINKLGYSLIMIVGFILNLFFLWSLKQIIAIEDWKRNNQESLESAFDVIAEYEALLSLTSLHINYPEWCFPQIAEGDGYTVTAKNLAHPLIAANISVKNDYELNNTFKVDIITGSNMAGKSTFLRTVGINAMLALSGAPVCADAMEVSVIIIVSYMRIKDSLNESTSTFKAELDRLQMLLAAVETEPKVFFLIDEMLRGTNSVDKYLGSKAVIEQLISKKGVGMVATHDLQIAQLEQQYPDYVRNFYFDIQVINGEMLFDYKMKHGECKTFNASLLLKQIGINIKTE